MLRSKEAKAGFLEREGRREAEWEAEKETGDSGVFALVNGRLGDGSEVDTPSFLEPGRQHGETVKKDGGGGGA